MKLSDNPGGAGGGGGGGGNEFWGIELLSLDGGGGGGGNNPFDGGVWIFWGFSKTYSSGGGGGKILLDGENGSELPSLSWFGTIN